MSNARDNNSPILPAPQGLTFTQLAERMDLLHRAAMRYPGKEAQYMCEVLGALMNRISLEDLQWALEVGHWAFPLTENLRKFPASTGAKA